MLISRNLLVMLAALACADVATAATLKKGDAFPRVEGVSTGHVTLVDFWASWCAPCKASFPAMERIHQKFSQQGFQLVAISVDKEEDAMHRFLEDHPVHFRVMHDANQRLVSMVDIPAMPTSFLLDKRGRVVSMHEGFRADETEESLMAEIQQLLESDK